MITNGSHSRPAAIGATIQFLLRSKWIFSLAIAGLVTVAATSPPQMSDENTDEEYIRIMNLMDRADALRATGKEDAAKAKDKDAYRALMYFHRTHPRWNTKTVEYRLNQLAEEIEGKPKESETPTAPRSHANLEAPAKRGSTETMSTTATTKLVDAGKDPRKAFRLHLKAGDKQAMIITLKMNMSMATPAAGGAAQSNAVPSIPAISLPVDLAVQDVPANGDITYEMTFEEPGIADEPGTAPATAQAMKALLSGIKGVSATGVVSDRGVTKKVDIKLPSNANPQVRQTVEQITESVSDMGPQLPEEPVGMGAKWEVKSTVKVSGVPLEKTTDFQLISIDGDHLGTTFTQLATNQKTQNTPGGGTQMGGIQITNSGSIASDLSKLMALQATTDSHSEVNGMTVGVNINLEAH